MKTRKGRIIWEAKKEEQLVDFMKRRDHVWNNKNPNFTNLRLRKKAFSEFAAVLGGEYTVKTVRERWTNIRNTYMNNLRRIERTQQSAKYPDEIYEPSWHLWDRCQFMNGVRDHLKKDDSSGELNLSVKVEDNDTSFIDEVFENASKGSCRMSTEDPIAISVHKNLPSASAMDNPSHRTHQHRGTEKSACELVLGEALHLLSKLQNEMRAEETGGRSSFSNISKHVAERLEKMRPFDAECASRKIMDILALYNELNPNNPNRKQL